jgi:TolB-like protein
LRRLRRNGTGQLAVLLLVAQGCLYGFAGGGLPPHIRTVAIIPFDNQTADPQLTQEVTDAVREALERRLGLRIAGEPTADAVVRGSVTRYEPGMTLSVQPGDVDRGLQVTRRRVLLTVTVEIIDQQAGRPLWQRQGLTVDGEYEPPNEREGRQLALRKLVNDIVDGAQSQW